jgi:hypothetical protein
MWPEWILAPADRTRLATHPQPLTLPELARWWVAGQTSPRVLLASPLPRPNEHWLAPAVRKPTGVALGHGDFRPVLRPHTHPPQPVAPNLYQGARPAFLSVALATRTSTCVDLQQPLLRATVQLSTPLVLSCSCSLRSGEVLTEAGRAAMLLVARAVAEADPAKHAKLNDEGMDLLDLDPQLGLQPFFALIAARLTDALLRPRHPSARLECCAAFVVHYDSSMSPDLGRNRQRIHEDCSDVTLNICLHASQDMQGGELCFASQPSLMPSVLAAVRTALGEQEADLVPHPDMFATLPVGTGTSLLHRGRHVHATAPLTAGSRTNLVLW